MKKYDNIIVRILKGFGGFVLAQIMSVFLMFSLIAVSNSLRDFVIFNLLIALCCLILTNGLFFNWAFNCAKKDKDIVKYHNVEYKKSVPICMAIFAPITTYISYIALILSYFKAIPDFFSNFLFANMYLTPLVSAFTELRTVDGLNAAGLIGLLFVILISPATIIITYFCTFNDIDIIKKLLYKKQG